MVNSTSPRLPRLDTSASLPTTALQVFSIPDAAAVRARGQTVQIRKALQGACEAQISLKLVASVLRANSVRPYSPPVCSAAYSYPGGCSTAPPDRLTSRSLDHFVTSESNRRTSLLQPAALSTRSSSRSSWAVPSTLPQQKVSAACRLLMPVELCAAVLAELVSRVAESNQQAAGMYTASNL